MIIGTVVIALLFAVSNEAGSYVIQGLLDLYEATFDEHWIQWAYALQQRQDELFYDTSGQSGGYYNVPDTDKSILVRMKEGT